MLLDANESGNLTLPGVGGSYSNASYDYNKLRFSNGTMELNVSDAHSATYDWIDDTKEINYWNKTTNKFNYVCEKLGIAGGDLDCRATTFNSWQGYFIWSNYDNITLIRQN